MADTSAKYFSRLLKRFGQIDRLLLALCVAAVTTGCDPASPSRAEYREVSFRQVLSRRTYDTVGWNHLVSVSPVYQVEFEGTSWNFTDFEAAQFVKHGARAAHQNESSGRVVYYLDRGAVKFFCTYNLKSRELLDIQGQVWAEDEKVRFTLHEGSVDLPCTYPQLLESLGTPAEIGFAREREVVRMSE